MLDSINIAKFKLPIADKISIVLFVLLIGFGNSVFSQNSFYEPEKTHVELGFSAGYVIFSTDVQISATFIRRVSDHFVLEFKPVVGFVKTAFLFNGQSSSKFTYYGGMAGVNFGKKNNFLELTTGAAYATNLKQYSLDSHFLSLWTVGYKHKFEYLSLRIGLGFPQGLYIGFNFAL